MATANAHMAGADTMTHRYAGGCHCGNLAFVFEAAAPLATLGLRADGCSFCRAHAVRHASDPNGTIAISVRDTNALSRYRFGHRTADFIICGRCGVYIGALMEDDGRRWFVVNANALRPPPPEEIPLVRADLEGEDVAARIARRKQKWTPVVALEIGDG